MIEIELSRSVRWCEDCGMDLSLSNAPLVIDENSALCDVCANSFRTHGESVEKINRDRDVIRQKIRDYEMEIEELEAEREEIQSRIYRCETDILNLQSQLR